MSQPPTSADILLHPEWVVPVLPHGVVLENYSVALTGNTISALLPRSETHAIAAASVLELPGQVVLPGLINCHGHSGMSLLRGYADDQSLMPWLENYIWPAEDAHVSEEFTRDGVELAIAEMIRAGSTTFADQFFFPDIAAATAQNLGMRCQIAIPVFDFPSAWGRDADDYISKGLTVRDAFKHSALVTVVFGPHSTYTVAEENLAKVATLAAELDAPIHIHMHETAAEVLQAVEQRGERPLDTLQRLGMLGPRTQCVHMTDIGDQDIALLVATGAHVVHCPQSNMKLASGICPVHKLLDQDVNVALGTDSAASNNALNLFGEMQAAALLAKVNTGDATVLPAATALAMATINGARAMGLAEHLGSVEVGKQADLIAVDLTGPETQPVFNPLSQLVYSCNGSQVRHSWIAGEQVLADRQLTRIDLDDLYTRTRNWQQRISNNPGTAATGTAK